MMLNKLSLNTIGLNRIGLNRIGKPSRGSSGRPYIDPEVLASLKAVCICYGKSNDDPDRAIVKNLVDPDNPFVISNASFKLNSGFGKYEITFQYFPYIENVTNVSDSKVVFGIGGQLLIPYSAISENVPSFKIKVNGLSGTYHFRYYYRSSDGVQHSVNMAQDGYYELPICYNVQSSSDGTNCGFANNGKDVVTITQIPSFEGAFVTDGIDDLITSTKTVQEMGITDEITVVSMIHQIGFASISTLTRTNNIRVGSNFIMNNITDIGKTGIYGYSYKNNASLINNILGDKNDYQAQGDLSGISAKFSVEGLFDGSAISQTSQVAWYWTVIANKVLTTDQINQVIAYYNLDRCVEPTVLYDVKKQGLSNDTPDSDWYLKDFSKNGFDMSLFNFAKKGNSGVGKYETDFTAWILDKVVDITISSSTFNSKTKNDNKINSWIVRTQDTVTPAMKVKITGITPTIESFIYRYSMAGGKDNYIDFTSDGIYELPKTDGIGWEGFRIIGNNFNVTVEQIPSHAGALCFDGVEDYGKVTGLPIYKDYTVVADREVVDGVYDNADGGIATKGNDGASGAFLFDYINQVFSFGEVTDFRIDPKRFISYQSKYMHNNTTIKAGNVTDKDFMCIAKMGDLDRYSKLALWSLLLFPYSMSEFLIERQLKKHKLGTLYPDMVEWRPIYTSNVNDYTITKATYFGETGQHDLALGNHYPIGTRFRIYVKPSGAADEVTSIKVNGVELTYDYIDSNYGYAFNGTLSSKSPQKIDITIDEYIRYEDIVQPYPAIVTLKQDGKDITWGDKLKVGSEVLFANKINLLPDLYQLSLVGAVIYNETVVYGNSPIKVEKSMVFKNSRTYLKSNEPKCILSPSRLRIPNSSYKILGYIPDISGHGNHGKINNSAYAEGSGVNADGSYQLDGVDDFIAIPTTVGGKQVIMKVIWDDVIADAILYDQRGYPNEFAIYNADNDNSGNPVTAYQARNNGKTYIDGILNSNIKASELKNVNHIITITNELSSGANNSFSTIGRSRVSGAYFTNMSLYDFMSFDEISTDEEILTLNEYVGIEGNTDDLFTENN